MACQVAFVGDGEHKAESRTEYWYFLSIRVWYLTAPVALLLSIEPSPNTSVRVDPLSCGGG
jgi:hypothetical protein